jgi:NAD(P) transhydrogenase subunit beta
MDFVLKLGYFIAALTFIVGFKFLSSPTRSKLGNSIAALGMSLAALLTIIAYFSDSVLSINFTLILVAIIIGTIVGKIMSDKVEMTKMPQLISLFNAMGGGVAVLLGIIESQQIAPDHQSRTYELVLLSGLFIGGTAFSGSIAAYRKLDGKLKDKRSKIIMYGARLILGISLSLPLLISLNLFELSLSTEVLILSAFAILYGIFFVLPIGGADMPVVISLLNSLTGIATALAGFVFGNLIMVTGGIFVGASGVLLTVMMCNAMNRSLWKVLSGKFKSSGVQTTDEEIEIQQTTIGESATMLAFANKIAIIPGYGMAVAQAQHLCNQLEKILEENDTEVHYIIHPVAGRMPGHMNVLLAEADVHYNKLKEMEEVNQQMNQYDVAIVIGANDVINPAAEQDEHSPIYGMPIIKAYNAGNVIVIKRGMSKGYAGVENKLFGYSNCKLLFSDAKKALSEIINELKNLEQ